MKIIRKIIIDGIFIVLLLVLGTFAFKKINNTNSLKNDTASVIKTTSLAFEKIEVKPEQIRIEVYEHKTKEELITMLNKSLNSTISNKGSLIANYSLEVGVDPVLATAIILEESGCKWNCSYLVKACNNVAGITGGTKCAGMGNYGKFSSLDEGIRYFIRYLKQYYYNYGLNTPEKMWRKYCGNHCTNWANEVNNYIKEIKSK